MRNSQLEVRPISGAGGAEIFGVDVAQDLDDGTVGEIRDALNEHCVVFFRDQEIDVAQHKRFARKFGEIFLHPNFATVMEDPEVVMVRREPGDLSYVGEDWHTDTTMCAEPPMGAILYGIDVPPYGGDTMFANQYLAYEALSPTMKKLLDGLRAVHSDIGIAGPQASRNKLRSTKNRDDDGWRETRSTHPIVRTNPGDRPQMPVRQRVLHGGHRGHDRGRRQGAARFPARARPPAGIHLPLPLAEGIDRLLGQSQRQAHRARRHRPLPPPDAPHPGRRWRGAAVILSS